MRHTVGKLLRCQILAIILGILFLASAHTQQLAQSGRSPLLDEVPAADAPNLIPIQVGRNVRVSTNADRDHAEVHLAADPKDPNRLAACSIIEERPRRGIAGGGLSSNTILYLSQDGGRTWASAIEDSASVEKDRDMRGASSWDPTCEYGQAGTLYFATGTRVTAGASGLRVRLHRSLDWGRTWLASTLVASGFFDKPWLVADTRPGSPNVGRLYLAYAGSLEGDPRAAVLVSSADRGTSFSAPIGTTFQIGEAAGGVVLSDGTLVTLTTRGGVLVSTDGGQHIKATSGIGHEGGLPPSIAADLSGGPYRDRIYVAWEADRKGRKQILVAYSTDKGTTWSQPKVVNDDRPRLPIGAGPDNFMPAIAVNRDGVVGISWHDRRDNPDNLGYCVRFSSSLDGAETWSPSVRVSEQPYVATNPLDAHTPVGLTANASGNPGTSSVQINIGRTTFDVGHYAGLAASADGVFHALWVDNRTGVNQVWTAPIRVEGQARLNAALDGLADVTNTVALSLENATFQRTNETTGVISGDLYLTNRAKDTLRGPLRLQMFSSDVTSLHTQGRVVLAPDLHHRKGSDVWDLSSGLRGGILAPGDTSEPVPIRFQLTDLTIKPQGPEKPYPEIFRLDLRMRVFAEGSVGQDVGNKILREKIYNDEIKPAISQEGAVPDWDAIEKQIVKKHGSIAQELVWKIKPDFYFHGKDWTSFQTSLSRYARKYGTDGVHPMRLNNYAWAIFENFGDKNILEEAAAWTLQSVQKMPNNTEPIDTYANILYRLGRTKEAIEWEEKALSLSTVESDKNRFQATIDKMKKGEPTWPLPPPKITKGR